MLAAIGLYIIAAGATMLLFMAWPHQILGPVAIMLMCVALIACGGILIGAFFWRR